MDLASVLLDRHPPQPPLRARDMMQGHLEDDDLFALHLTPEIATRKSRLVLSLMVSLAGGGKRPRGRRRAEGDPQAADRERAQVAQLVRDLIDDRVRLMAWSFGKERQGLEAAFF